MGRAVETAKIIAEKLSISNITTDSFLMERNLGVLQGRIVATSKLKFPHFWNATGSFIQDSDIPGAESIEDFLHRIGKGIDNLSELSKTKNILVVTHDGVLHAIVSHLKGIHFSQVGKFYQFKNCDPVMLN